MKVIGIAGESGTGKTMIGEHLAGRGAVHIDADRVGHELLVGSRDVIDAVRAIFGDSVFDGDGVVDRRKLGEHVFADEDLRKRLNSVIHPAIRARCGELVEEARERGAPFVVIDAALLLDSQMPFSFDLLMGLRASHEVQVERLLARGGYTEQEIRARLASQEAVEKSFYKAGVVVDTEKERDEVLAEIDRLVDGIVN